MNGEDKQAKVYVLRMWHESPSTGWCISIRSPDEDHPVGLANATSLLKFIEHEQRKAETNNRLPHTPPNK